MHTRIGMITWLIHHLLDKFQITLYLNRLLRLGHFHQILQRVPKQEALLFIRVGTKAFHHVIHDKVCLLHLIFTTIEINLLPLPANYGFVRRKGA